MKFTKRLLSIMLTLLLMLGMIPFAALTASAETNISKIEVEVEAPVAGEAPSYSVTLKGDGYDIYEEEWNGYAKNGITWYCNDTIMNPTDDTTPQTFEKGNNYTFKIELYRNSGYVFPDLSTIPVTINGNDAYIVYPSHSFHLTGFIQIEYTFTTVGDEKLDSIDIVMDNYAVSNYTTDLTFSSQDPIETTGSYGENGLFVVKISNGNQLVPISKSTINENTYYYLTYNIRIVGDYNGSDLEIDDIRLNGQKAIGLLRPSEGIIQATFQLPKLEKPKTEIYMIALRLPNVPKVGEKVKLPTVQAINGDEELIGEIEMNDCYWGCSPYDSLSALYTKIDENAYFQNGKAYQLNVEFYLPDGYVFSDDFFIMLLCPEGELIDTEFFVGSSKKQLTFNYYRNFDAPTQKPALKKIELSLSGYLPGKNITDSTLSVAINGDLLTPVPVPCGDAFVILNEDMSILKSGTFKENTQYYLACIFGEHPNYEGDYEDLSKFILFGSPAIKGEKQGINCEYYFKLPKLSSKKVTITTQPKTTYAKEGATAKVTVKATGDDLKYEWYIKNSGATKYTKSSVTKSTYSTTVNSKSHGRRLYCVITDMYGNKVQSNTVLIRRQATITKQPSATVYAKKGSKATVKLTALGDGLTYTWYTKNSGASKYSKSSVTSATYSVTMADKVKGRRIYCVVKDKYGKTVQSTTFLLRESVSIVTQPKTVTVKKNATAKVTVKASGDGLKYTWYVKNAGASKYTKSSVTKSYYSTTMNSKSKNRLVYCVVTDKYGKTVKSNTVTLKMK